MLSKINDRFVRSVVFISVTLLLLITWGFGGVSKLLAGGVPEWFTKTFSETFLAGFPGLTASFYSIALLETLAGVLAFGSLVRGECIRAVRPALLYAALCLSLLLFVQLNFGNQLISNNSATHDLYMYFAGTLVMLGTVRLLDTTATSRP